MDRPVNSLQGEKFNFFLPLLLILALGLSFTACDMLPAVLPNAEEAPTVDVLEAARKTISASTQGAAQPGGGEEHRLSFTFAPTWTSSPAPSATDTPQRLATSLPDGRPVCVPADSPIEIGVVTNVVDGDTIDVQYSTGDGRTYRVHYLGVKAPEILDPFNPPAYFGMEAIAKNRELTAGRMVLLLRDELETNLDGNLLRYVFVESLSGIFVNYILLSQGFATIELYPPDMGCAAFLTDAEYVGRSMSYGMWMPTPLPTFTSLPTPTNTATPTGTVTPTRQPTRTGIAPPCNCAGPDLDCPDFRTQARAQACYDYCKAKGYGDIFRLNPRRETKVCPHLK